jgi:hypothetical protein
VEQLWAGTGVAAKSAERVQYCDAAADISLDGLYRYKLMRQLSPGARTVLFVGLNPSTATALEDDPTVRHEVMFARRWGFNRYLKGNLYGYRSPYPTALEQADDPVGPANRRALEKMAQEADIVVAAWGTSRLSERAREIANWITSLEKTHCLGFTKQGSPKHPLCLGRDTPLMRVRP